MMDYGLAAGTGVLSLIVAFLVVLAVLWFILPFIIFAINDHVKESVKIQKEILTFIKAREESKQKHDEVMQETLAQQVERMHQAPVDRA